MRWHWVDETAELASPRPLVHRRAWLYGKMPAPLRCRAWGHVPAAGSAGDWRWVECRRCRRRPVPGEVGSTHWTAGDHEAGVRALVSADPRGGWPAELTLGAEVIVERRSSWRGFGLGVTLCGPGEEHDAEAHVSTPWAALYLTLEGPLHALAQRLPLGEERRVELELTREGTLRWALWWDTRTWHRDDPRWRAGHLDLRDLALGRAVHSSQTLSVVRVELPLPEGPRPATLTLERATWRRPRWPHELVVYRAEVVPDVPTPVPGKGENSWDIGDDAVHSSSFPVRPGDEWPAEAIGTYVTGVLRTRARHGGSVAWQPREDA